MSLHARIAESKLRVLKGEIHEEIHDYEFCGESDVTKCKYLKKAIDEGRVRYLACLADIYERTEHPMYRGYSHISLDYDVDSEEFVVYYLTGVRFAHEYTRNVKTYKNLEDAVKDFIRRAKRFIKKRMGEEIYGVKRGLVVLEECVKKIYDELKDLAEKAGFTVEFIPNYYETFMG